MAVHLGTRRFRVSHFLHITVVNMNSIYIHNMSLEFHTWLLARKFLDPEPQPIVLQDVEYIPQTNRIFFSDFENLAMP